MRWVIENISELWTLILYILLAPQPKNLANSHRHYKITLKCLNNLEFSTILGVSEIHYVSVTFPRCFMVPQRSVWTCFSPDSFFLDTLYISSQWSYKLTKIFHKSLVYDIFIRNNLSINQITPLIWNLSLSWLIRSLNGTARSSLTSSVLLPKEFLISLHAFLFDPRFDFKNRKKLHKIFCFRPHLWETQDYVKA